MRRTTLTLLTLTVIAALATSAASARAQGGWRHFSGIIHFAELELHDSDADGAALGHWLRESSRSACWQYMWEAGPAGARGLAQITTASPAPRGICLGVEDGNVLLVCDNNAHVFGDGERLDLLTLDGDCRRP